MTTQLGSHRGNSPTAPTAVGRRATRQDMPVLSSLRNGRLMARLEGHTPDVYQQIIEADRRSAQAS